MLSANAMWGFTSAGQDVRLIHHVLSVIPRFALPLATQVCGVPDVDVELLKQMAEVSGKLTNRRPAQPSKRLRD